MKRISLLALSVVCASASAVENQPNKLGGTFSATAEESDNALRTTDDTISERQDRLLAGLFAFYENDLLELDTDYTAEKKYFEKETQADRDAWTGRTSLRLGKDHHLFDLRLSHLRQKQLVSAELVELDKNLDEKQILTAQPGFHTKLTPVDAIYLQGNLTEVDYRFEELNNSQREGGVAGWSHAFSSVDTLGIYFSHTDVDFEFVPQVDYRFQYYALSYTAQLRQLGYKFDLGQSRMESQGDDAGEAETNPYYLVQVDYSTGYHQWSLTLTERGGDTSMGLGEDSLGDSTGFGQTGSLRPDRINMQRATISWTTQALCLRCQVNINAFTEKREYLSLARDEQGNGIAFSLGYRFSNAASINLRALRGDQEFEGVTNLEDFFVNQVGVDYVYNFSSGVALRLFASEFQRRSDTPLQEYDEVRFGVTLSYQFNQI